MSWALKLTFNGIQEATKALDGKINVVNVWKEIPNVQFGEATQESRKICSKIIRAAVAALKNDEIDVLVTAPINKNNIQAEDFKFPGHTDYLPKNWKAKA